MQHVTVSWVNKYIHTLKAYVLYDQFYTWECNLVSFIRVVWENGYYSVTYMNLLTITASVGGVIFFFTLIIIEVYMVWLCWNIFIQALYISLSSIMQHDMKHQTLYHRTFMSCLVMLGYERCRYISTSLSFICVFY